MRKNFSQMEHSCRKCLCSKTDLINAESYSDIHADTHENRTDQNFQNDYLESQVI
jgi:hypothetical protein